MAKSIWEILIEVTPLTALILGSAYISVQKTLEEGIVFLAAGALAYVFIYYAILDISTRDKHYRKYHGIDS